MENAGVGDVLRAMTNAERARFVIDNIARATGAICGLNSYPGLGLLGLGRQVH